MKKKTIASILFVVMLVILCFNIYIHNRTNHLDLEFWGSNGPVEITKVVIYGSVINNEYGVSSQTVEFNDKKSICEFISFLNEIPLTYVCEGKSFLGDSKGCFVEFYDDDICFSWIRVNSDNQVQNSMNMKIYKPKKKGTVLLDELASFLTNNSYK